MTLVLEACLQDDGDIPVIPPSLEPDPCSASDCSPSLRSAFILPLLKKRQQKLDRW